MDFNEISNFVVANSSADHFNRDKELFLEKCPVTRLNNDLARVNDFNRKHFDGRILRELLKVVTPEEILNNRKGIVSKLDDAPVDDAPVDDAPVDDAPVDEPNPEQPVAQKTNNSGAKKKKPQTKKK